MWKISIDTGGTFTDCIGTNPDGEVLRAKVLSSSRLRGVLVEKITSSRFRFSHQWRIGEDIFKAFSFCLTGQEFTGITVQNINFKEQIIELSENPFDAEKINEPDLSKGIVFEITSHEEAPVLAVRMITKTPLHEPLPQLEMRLGSTKGTNALLEKKGAQVVFLITKGLKDLIRIGTQQRPSLFQLNIPEPDILYSHVIEVEERIQKDGSVLHPLRSRELKRIVFDVKKSGANSVAVALMHAWRNPIHEQLLKEALEKEDIRFISLSHELMPGIKILPRAHTALVNAYLEPVLYDYLSNIKKVLFQDGTNEDISRINQPKTELRVMTSAGGLVNVQHFNSKDSLLSGPAGGVVGAASIARSLGFEKVITLDMGGTSTDTARFDGAYDYEYFTRIGEITMLSPCLAIETVAAGGGSICSFDGTKLTVGPESAGATPGPACYGAGGPLAITDINLLLNKIDPSEMGIPISWEKSKEALETVRESVLEKTGLNYTEEELLRGFEKIANEKMAEAIRKISVSKGFDPQDYALLVFGGAGGLHGCRIAELLGISTLILPYDGGLLSAFGIGEASVERFAQQQILLNLHQCVDDLPGILTTLTNSAKQELMKEGFIENQVEVRSVYIYLRFKGQESSLEIPISVENIVSGFNQIEVYFEKKYRGLFGHYPGDRPVEVESAKVVVASKQKDIVLVPNGIVPEKKLAVAPRNGVVHWDELEQGMQLEGPQILLNNTSTAFLEKGWAMEVAKGKNIVLRKQKEVRAEQAGIANDGTGNTNPIELELFTNRFTSIAEEMGAQLQRTAFSVNIKERLDFSCALLDAEAGLLVNAPHIPVHLGSLGICARLILEKLPLGPGDVIITNHPKYGGSHLPDVTLVMGVFVKDHKGKMVLVGYAINRAHHAEIGGSRPGSMPPDARTLVEEGIVIPPMYLVKNGAVQWGAMEDLLVGSPFPTRALHENLADINAALASLRTGEEKLKALVQEYGFAKVQRYMAKLKETASDALTEALKPYGSRIFTATEKLDDGHIIASKIALNGEKGNLLEFDFSGTSPVHPFNLNANISIVYSAVLYVLRLLCAKEIPLNEGLMKYVRIELPKGSFLHPVFEDNPRLCPAVVGGNTEVSQRLVDTLLKALAPLTRVACSQGTMNNFLFGNEHFGYYETIGGGVGAGIGYNGRPAVHQHMTNTKITDPEELEFRYPVRLNRFAIRPVSGGAGKWKGGDGIIRELEFLEEVDMTIISQHRNEAPYGIEGGKPGKKGRQIVKRVNGAEEILQGVDSRRLQKGDRVIIETPGGGGAGTEN